MSATTTGKKVLANLAAGRDALNAERKKRAAWYRRIIAEFAMIDMQDRWPAWGRAGRITQKLKGKLSERQVKRYLDALTCASDSACHGASHNIGGLTA